MSTNIVIIIITMTHIMNLIINIFQHFDRFYAAVLWILINVTEHSFFN